MKEQVLQNLATTGICVIEEYYDKEFCEQAIKDIEDGLIKYPDKVQSESKEGTSGDFRLFKMENRYDTGKRFAGKVTHNPDKQTNSGGGWHRDNRAKQVKTLVYLSDVSEENGPYLFLPHSDKFDLPTRDGVGKVTRYEDKIIEEFCKENKFEPFRVAGKAGTVIFTDTSFIHRGANINSGTRYTYTNYYFENHPQRIAITENDWGKSFI
jgi:hypothetical protein